MKHYSPIGRRSRGRPLKRLLDTWDRNGSTSGLTPWQTYDDDDDETSRLDSSRQAANNLGSSKVILVVEWRYVCTAAHDGHRAPSDKDKARSKWLFNILPCHFTPRKGSRHSLERRLNGTQCKSGRTEWRKNFFPLPEFELRILQPVAYSFPG